MLVSMPTLAPVGMSNQSFQKVATTDKATARSPKRTPCLFIGFLLSGRQYHILQLSEPSPKTRTPARDAEALNGRVDRKGLSVTPSDGLGGGTDYKIKNLRRICRHLGESQVAPP